MRQVFGVPSNPARTGSRKRASLTQDCHINGLKGSTGPALARPETMPWRPPMNFVPRFGQSETQPASAAPEIRIMPPASPRHSGRTRDIRLDFFRGLAMMIILVSHIPFDDWALWIPARFGFSDATEMFVFQSGMASALAFGGTFRRQGWTALLVRIARRIWQIYWAHVGVFVVVIALLSVAGTRPGGESYIDSLNLLPFVHDPARMMAAFLSLRYVPNYFDILPMYMALLAMLPLMLAAECLHRHLPLALMAALWLMAQAGWNLSAEPWSDRPWFFNPLGWQLCFFTGFFIVRGIISAPRPDWRLMALAALFILLAVPFALVRYQETHPFFRDAAQALLPLTDKTRFGFLRLLHFLALAYLAACLAGPGGARLKGWLVKAVVMIGQHSLAVFVVSMAAAQALGMALDQWGRSALPLAAVNIGGFLLLLATARLMRWLKQAEMPSTANPA